MPRRSTKPDTVVQFAGLTRHNQVTLSEKAQQAASSDYTGRLNTEVYPDEMPETSLATALRGLERAEPTTNAWQVPEQVARRLDVDTINDDAPDGVTAYETTEGDVFIATERFQSVVSPDKMTEWIQGEFRDEDSNQWRDPLWHVPTTDYTIVNPMDFYEPLEQALRDEDLGDSVFGEVRTYKGGGEVHMELLFDAFSIDLGDDTEGGPILLGIRTGYDYFGGTALYAEGFAQDRYCQNSIRNVTEEKTRRHVGEPSETREWWETILSEMDLMTDRLAEIIEEANNIEVDYLNFEFSELTGHNDDLQAWFEMAGFPSYLAREAASNVRSRAENQFLPTMWEMHSGATYAVTHHYRGGENTSRLNDLVNAANDMVMNPAQSINTVDARAEQFAERQRREADNEGELDEFSYSAAVEKFQQDISHQRDEFETRQEELRSLLVTADGDTETEESEEAA